MSLDIRTLSLLAVLVSLLMAGAMVLLWRINPGQRSARFWALGNCAIALGFLLIGLRGTVPMFLSVPVANTLITLGYGLMLAGVWEFMERKVHWWLVQLSAGGLFAAFLYLTYLKPDIGWRITLVSSLIAMLSILAARALLQRGKPGMFRIQKVTALVFALHAFYLLMRSLITLTGAPVHDLFSTNLVQSLAFLDVIVAAVCLNYGFTALVNRRLQLHLDHLASHDMLTRVFNRWAFELMVRREITRGKRRDSMLSLLLLDIDHFKRVNDNYGHQAGDGVLREVAGLLAQLSRQEDVVARLGGEEFCVLLPDTSLHDALEIAERLREAIHLHPVKLDDTFIDITVSVGCAALPAGEASWKGLYHQADAALYKAKEGGRNLIAVPTSA